MLQKLKNSVWPWPLLFFACLFPFSAVYLLHFPDERHYVDAAIRMLDTGDYWLPQTAEGLPRFKKPLLAYWLTTASFGIFGIYEFAARLPFLLTACLILWLTWRMTFYLFADKTKASLASAILLCHIPFVMAAVRSMPDILYCLGILMAAYGIARTMFWEDRGWHAYFILYGGLLITLQSKGLLGFVLIGYAWIYALTIRSRAWLQHAWRHLCGLIVVSAIAGAWFWWVEQQYADAVPIFLNDQVTEKIEAAPVKILIRFFGYILNFLGLFSLPWVVAIVYARDRHTFAKSPPNEEGVMHLRRFVFGWFLLCVLLFSFGKLYTIRYLLPVSPLFSIVLADALSRTDSIRLTACYGLFIKLLSLLFWGLGMLFAVLYAQLEQPTNAVISFTLFGVAAFMLIQANSRLSGIESGFTLAIGLLMIWPLLFAGLKPALPDSGSEAALILRNFTEAQDKPVLFIGSPSSASRVRLAMQGKAAIRQQKHWQETLSRTYYAAILVPVTEWDQHQMPGYHLAGRYVGGFKKVFQPALAEAIINGRFKAYLEEKAMLYQVWIAD